MKIYTRMPLTEEEFQALRNLASEAEQHMRKMAELHAKDTDSKAHEFYQAKEKMYRELHSKFDQVLIDDTSQDAEPEEDEEGEEESDE